MKDGRIEPLADAIVMGICGLPLKKALSDGSTLATNACGIMNMALEACNVHMPSLDAVYKKHGRGLEWQTRHFNAGLLAYRAPEYKDLFAFYYEFACKELGILKAPTTNGEDRDTKTLRGNADGGARSAERGAGRGRSLVVEQRATPGVGQPREGDAQPGSGIAHRADTPGERAQRRA